MASGQVDGLVRFRAGKRSTQTRVLGALDSTVWDNAAGADPAYINGINRPEGEGEILDLGPGPHLGGGDNLYITIQNTGASDIVDSDDELATLHLEYADYDANTGALLGTDVYEGVADRNTDRALGGLPDDPSVDANREAFVIALGPVPSGVVRTFKGRTQGSIRNDTA